jgi:hypothetical protein
VLSISTLPLMMPLALPSRVDPMGQLVNAFS